MLENTKLVSVAGIVVCVIAIMVTRPSAAAKPTTVALPRLPGDEYTVYDTTVDATIEASGIAAPIQQATLSTRLIGTVVDVEAREGDVVAAGQVLVRIDARDMTAKSTQASAAIAEAQARLSDAQAQARRIRGLYADSAATRAQLDAAETGLARARAGLEGAQAAATELGAVSSYSVIRAPFAGVVTKRFVDAGAFATPGAPLVTIQDVSVLRISASTTPDIARGLRRRQTLSAHVEQSAVSAAIEGVVPSPAGSLYMVNALVTNPDRTLLAGSRAALELRIGKRRMLVVPQSAIIRAGDLTGVTLRTAQGDDRRWVRIGRAIGDMIEVTAGLTNGDCVVVPNASTAAARRP